jgi:hypothetical protein
MRKLIWCGVTGLAVVAGGYRAFRHVEARTDLVPSGQSPPTSGKVASHGDYDYYPAQPVSGACGQEACDTNASLFARGTNVQKQEQVIVRGFTDEPAPQSPDNSIELQGAGGVPTQVIDIPLSDEPPLALPVDSSEPTTDLPSTPFPGVMPYAEEDGERVVRMPYAEDPAWPSTKPVAAQKSAEWFEESEPEIPATVPEWREDENLSRQYPGLPVPASKPAEKGQKKAAPRHEQGEPFLPIQPEIGPESPPPASGNNTSIREGERNQSRLGIFEGSDDASEKPTITIKDPNADSPFKDILVRVQDAESGNLSSRPTVDARNSSSSHFSGGVGLYAPSARKHVSYKFIFARDSENTARQPVDTLELRPGDLRKGESEPQPF